MAVLANGWKGISVLRVNEFASLQGWLYIF
jgi:hypothetical protein